MAQDISSASHEAVNLLALDGGGIRGISELLVLNEIMRRVQHDLQLAELPRPCEYFDLIGGTSTGGLIALMLGRLRMRTDEAIETYNLLARAIFSKENKKWKGQDGLFKASTLEHKVKELVSKKKRGERMLDPSTSTAKGKAFVCAMPSHDMEYPRRFRTYPVRALASANCEIWEAARATSAAPNFFKRVVISDGRGAEEEFIDGGLRCNNPVTQVLEEAREVFGNDRSVGCLVSIGTGHTGTIGLARPESWQKFLPTKLIGALAKIATDCEATANELSTRFKDHEKLYYRFNVEHGTEGISLEEWGKMGELTEHTNAYLRKVAVSKAIDEVVHMLCHPRSMGRTLGSLSGVSQMNMFSVPFSLSEVSESLCFVAREKELGEIHATLSVRGGRRVAVVHGMGGIGKTQVTIAYAKRHKDEYSSIFWLNCKDEDSLRQSFLRAAQRIIQEHPSVVGLGAVEEDKSLEEVVNTVKQWFDQKGHTQWLLIYDNYDNPKLPGTKDTSAIDIKKYLPDVEQGSIIITSRLSEVGLGHPIELKTLKDTQDGLQILAHTSGRLNVMEDNDARRIAERLDGLPLALATAGAYLRQVGTSLARYLQLHDESWLKLQQKSPLLATYDQALYSTWQLSYAHIEQQNPLAAKLLKLWAYFNNQDLWYELLHEGLRHCDEVTWISELVEDDLSFTDAARVICNHGLIEVDTSLEEGTGESQGYSMHACVHEWTKHVLNQEFDTELARAALTMVAAHVPKGGNPDSWILRRRLMQHAARCWSSVLNGEVTTESLAWTLLFLGYLYSDQGNLEEAEKMFIRALPGYEQALGPNHFSTLNAVSSLGMLYRNQGKLDEAEKMYMRALAWWEHALGPNYTPTLDIFNQLSVVYMCQGKLEEAEKTSIRALAGYEQALGPNHPSTLDTVNNLGVIYSAQGRLEEAEKNFIRALAGREQAHGPNHNLTLNTVYQLGILYTDQGKLEEAEKNFIRTLAWCEQVLGPNQISTLSIVYRLGILYHNQGKLEEAEKKLIRALAGREQALGLDHVQTLDTVYQLGILYHDQGKLVEAEKKFIRALAGREQALGPNHSRTLRIFNNLGLLYSDQEKLEKAEKMYIRALTGREQALGLNHASTLLIVNNLGVLYMRQRKPEEAEKMYLRALTGYEQALGLHNVSKQRTIENLKILYKGQGKLEKLQELTLRLKVNSAKKPAADLIVYPGNWI